MEKVGDQITIRAKSLISLVIFPLSSITGRALQTSFIHLYFLPTLSPSPTISKRRKALQREDCLWREMYGGNSWASNRHNDLNNESSRPCFKTSLTQRTGGTCRAACYLPPSPSLHAWLPPPGPWDGSPNTHTRRPGRIGDRKGIKEEEVKTKEKRKVYWNYGRFNTHRIKTTIRTGREGVINLLLLVGKSQMMKNKIRKEEIKE